MSGAELHIAVLIALTAMFAGCSGLVFARQALRMESACLATLRELIAAFNGSSGSFELVTDELLERAERVADVPFGYVADR